MDVLNAYKSAARQLGLPEMHRGGCQLETQGLASAKDVWPALAAMSPRQGWLQFQSRQLAFHDGLPPVETEWGLLLAAEAATSDGHSLALSLDGAGGWTLTRYSHSQEGEMLYDEPTQLAHDPNTGRLRYRRWWRHDPAQGYVQIYACFIGFE